MYMVTAITKPMIPRRIKNFFTVPPSFVSVMVPGESIAQTLFG